MRRVLSAIRAFSSDESGATAIEYGLIAAGIFLAIVPPVAVIANKMGVTYNSILGFFTTVGV